MIGEQLFGLPISACAGCFRPGTADARAAGAAEIAGILNLRGRIVTLIDMRRCLGLPRRERGPAMAIGVE